MCVYDDIIDNSFTNSFTMSSIGQSVLVPSCPGDGDGPYSLLGVHYVSLNTLTETFY